MDNKIFFQNLHLFILISLILIMQYLILSYNQFVIEYLLQQDTQQLVEVHLNYLLFLNHLQQQEIECWDSHNNYTQIQLQQIKIQMMKHLQHIHAIVCVRTQLMELLVKIKQIKLLFFDNNFNQYIPRRIFETYKVVKLLSRNIQGKFQLFNQSLNFTQRIRFICFNNLRLLIF
ncbi:unnamed protein product [Paramecium sonneborni]|uniref:Transmembrane protein n=1 Tax=Paramecium sonneborni TaxID=65129 RepID=A0A8S1RPY2_9CILI|nr:unnamed protein product [Paramecium sonneborni]